MLTSPDTTNLYHKFVPKRFSILFCTINDLSWSGKIPYDANLTVALKRKLKSEMWDDQR